MKENYTQGGVRNVAETMFWRSIIKMDIFLCCESFFQDISINIRIWNVNWCPAYVIQLQASVIHHRWRCCVLSPGVWWWPPVMFLPSQNPGRSRGMLLSWSLVNSLNKGIWSDNNYKRNLLWVTLSPLLFSPPPPHIPISSINSTHLWQCPSVDTGGAWTSPIPLFINDVYLEAHSSSGNVNTKLWNVGRERVLIKE